MKCNCKDEIKTGQTSVMCCNVCGLPDEEFWQPPIQICDYCGYKLPDHETRCIRKSGKNYLDVLKENLEASKRHQNKSVRKLLVATYEDLISIWEANYAGKIWHPSTDSFKDLKINREPNDW